MLTFSWTDYPEIYDDEEKIRQIKIEAVENTEAPHQFIEGDNYPVLLKLGTEMAEKVDFIYIDPPYNTGKSFTYDDSFSVNQDTHSAWLSFMSRRLKAAKKLLKKSGCIFIAIDQSELYTLKLLCDQIFGEDNFVNDFMWLHGKGKKDRWSRTLQQHTLCYACDKSQLKPFKESLQTNWAKKNVDNDPRGNWFSGSISFTEKRSNPKHKNFYSITSPSGLVWTRQWMVSQSEMKELIEKNRIFWGAAPEYNKVPRIKIFNEEAEEVIPRNIIEKVDSTRAAQKHLDSLLGQKGLFDNPKPVSLITHLLKISCMQKDALVMDFFAGSGTTFEAVCELNKTEGAAMSCILVQKPEVLRLSSAKSEFKTIADLCWERCCRTALQYGTHISHLLLKN